MSEYEPGSVAVATVQGVPGVRVMRGRRGYWWGCLPGEGGRLFEDFRVTDVRPLTVVDPNGVNPAELADQLGKAAGRQLVVLDFSIGGPYLAHNVAQALRAGVTSWSATARIADQIEAQTRQPKPPEPTGLGAVVEDREGRPWVRFQRPDTPSRWYDASAGGGFPQKYADIDVVEVLSEGVTTNA